MFRFLKSLFRPSEPRDSGEAIVIGREMAQAAEAEIGRSGAGVVVGNSEQVGAGVEGESYDGGMMDKTA